MHNVTCRQVGSSFGGMDYCDLLRRFNGFNRSEQAAEVRELRSVECPYYMQLKNGQRRENANANDLQRPCRTQWSWRR